MATQTIFTRGFGNGTFNGTIPLVITRGYAIGAAVVITGIVDLTTRARDFSLNVRSRDFSLNTRARDFSLTVKER